MQGEDPMRNRIIAVAAVAALLATAGLAQAKPASQASTDDLLGSLTKGKVELKSAGPLAFGPQGILFAGDPIGATIYAIDTGDRAAASSSGRPNVEGIDDKIASLLGTEAKEV